MKRTKEELKYVTNEDEYADYVKCDHCGFKGLIQIIQDDCPECGKDADLMWADANNKVVKL